MTNIALNTKVVAPVTDAEGEESFVVGTLIDMNSRYATVLLDDKTTIKVGKTKIEPLVEVKAKARRKNDPAHEALEAGKVIIPTNKYEYTPCVAASGRKSLDNADNIAAMLRGKSLDEVYFVAAVYLETKVAELKARYSHLNVGQQRMCIGNKMRAKKC